MVETTYRVDRVDFSINVDKNYGAVNVTSFMVLEVERWGDEWEVKWGEEYGEPANIEAVRAAIESIDTLKAYLEDVHAKRKAIHEYMKRQRPNGPRVPGGM